MDSLRFLIIYIGLCLIQTEAVLFLPSQFECLLFIFFPGLIALVRISNNIILKSRGESRHIFLIYGENLLIFH